MKDNISISELITGIIAIYGAVLSTVIFRKEHQKSKRKIKIKYKIGALVFTQGIMIKC